jgi:hypothetical protein
MSDHILTTEEIREAYSPIRMDADGLPELDDSEARKVEFDTWLAAHDKQIEEKTRLSYQWHPSTNLLRSTVINSKNFEDFL